MALVMYVKENLMLMGIAQDVLMDYVLNVAQKNSMLQIIYVINVAFMKMDSAHHAIYHI